MWGYQVKIATALGTVALSGLVGAGIGVGYYLSSEKRVLCGLNKDAYSHTHNENDS